MTDPLVQLFSEVLDIPAADLSDDTSPKNTWQWDSLAAMQLVAAIESRFDVRLSTQDILAMTDIGKTRDILRGKNVAC